MPENEDQAEEEIWINALEDLPLIGQRVRVHCVKELTYMGNQDGRTSEWMYDGTGEHGVYSWCAKLRRTARV